MKRFASTHAQRGATLVVGLIMLVLITLLVTSAFTLSNTNVKSVGNNQIRNEAVAAANKAIEQVLSSPFSDAPAAESIDIDLNNDSTTDYTVDFAAPVCVSATVISGSSAPPSSITLGSMFAVGTPNYYHTIWDLDANVVDAASGATMRVRQGVRVLLNQAQFDAVCPD
jgi:hypothetical protein